MLLLAVPLAAWAQTTGEASSQNTRQARAALDAMVTALGGPTWLSQKNQMRQGRATTFFHGQSSGGATEFWEFHAWPDRDRIEFTKQRDVVQVYLGRAGWEVTYKGQKSLPQEQLDDYLRRRDHSIETVVKVWLNDPGTMLIDEGQRLAGRRLAEQVTLISAQNEAVTIQIDVETRLPLRRSFEWRDPVYKDKNQDAEEYDNYHTIDGIPTPLIVTRFKNSEMTSQRFLDHVAYNQDLPPDFWSVESARQRIGK
jgi:hypothetical protein